MTKKKPIIDLRYTLGNEPGLIVLYKSSVRYTNQTGGTNCLSPIEEGVYLPLFDELHDQGTALMAYFTDAKVYSTGTVGIDEMDAEFLDSILSVGDYTKYLKVDRTRLHDSHEAWLYVDIHFTSEISDFGFSGEVTTKEQIDAIMSPLYGFYGTKGVLTWMNSD
jgi:hypothetical protein